MEAAAFIILRITLAWMFLYPLKALLSDWPATVGLVKLLVPFQSKLCAILMVAVMIVGSMCILLGFYANIGAGLLFIYSLFGVVVHYRLGDALLEMKLSEAATVSDKKIFENAQKSGVVGHVTSAQKNIVIAAALLMIVFLGSGPFSLMH